MAVGLDRLKNLNEQVKRLAQDYALLVGLQSTPPQGADQFDQDPFSESKKPDEKTDVTDRENKPE